MQTHRGIEPVFEADRISEGRPLGGDRIMRMLEHILKAVRDAAVFNPEVEVAPACILWPDRDRQWEAVVPRLQVELPELLILGDYAPEKRIGALPFAG